MVKLRSLGKRMTLVATALALAGIINTAVVTTSHAEPPRGDLFCTHCGGAATGSLLYDWQGRYIRESVVLQGVGSDCGTLTVRGQVNRVDRTRWGTGTGGRRTLSLYFRDPATLGSGNSVLFEGTVLSDGSQQTYYGDIYQRSHPVSDCNAEKDVLDSACGWTHKGGFYFSRPSK